MPRVNADGTPRASAKERAKEKERGERLRSEMEKEDAVWRDDDKGVARKAKRADEKQKKQEDAAARKAENRALAAAEEEALGTAPKAKPPSKVSRASIQAAQEGERARIAKLAAQQELDRRGVVRPEPLEENPNKAMAALLEEEGAFEARSVEDAISLLSVRGGSSDEATRRRVKAAFIEFRESALPILQSENPGLRRSQLLEAVHKEWQRSPRNPANQP